MATNDFAVVGIDLGTTNCCVAYLDEQGMVEIIADRGERTTPSYIVKTDEEYLVGRIAKEDYPVYAVYDSKRLIGRTFDDSSVQDNLKNWTFHVKCEDNTPLIELPVASKAKSKTIMLKAEEVSAQLLKHMKQVAEDYLGKPVQNAIVTVPAHFGYHQRVATKKAAKLAELNVVGMINEPTAAALAYIHKHKLTGTKHIIVFDLGGGTFDVSVVKLDNKGVTVLATAGNTALGGRDFDNNLLDLIYKKLAEMYGPTDVSEEIAGRIRAGTETAKIELSRRKAYTLELPKFYKGEDVRLKISRIEFEEVNRNLFQFTVETMKNCLKDAKISPSRIHDLVLVGGSTNIPKIQQMLKEFFNMPLSKSINPDEAVAYGAAVQTAKFKGKEEVRKVADVTPLSLGWETAFGKMNFCIRRKRPIPVTVVASAYTTQDKQPNLSIRVFEGERSLVSDNTLVGKCVLKLPPHPPGHKVDLIFEIDGDGVLHVSALEESGGHTKLPMEYSPPDSKKGHEDALDKICSLDRYCIRLKAVCDYDTKEMSESHKGVILRQVGEIQWWIQVVRNSPMIVEEQEHVPVKTDLLDATCLPILLKYGYDIRHKTHEEFYQMVDLMKACYP